METGSALRSPNIAGKKIDWYISIFAKDILAAPCETSSCICGQRRPRSDMFSLQYVWAQLFKTNDVIG